MARHLDRIGRRLGRDLRRRAAPTGRLLPRHLPRPRRRQRRWSTVVDRVRAITGRIDLVHCNDSRDAFDSGADRHANFGARPDRPRRCSPRWSATPAPRWSARPPAAPRSTGPTSPGCASGSDRVARLAVRRGDPPTADGPPGSLGGRDLPALDRPHDLRRRAPRLPRSRSASASFLQTPAWGAGEVASGAASRSAGSTATASWSASALVLYRQLPRVQALPGLPARGPGHRLGRPTTSAAWLDADDRPPQGRGAPSASGWARPWSPAAGTPPRSRRASPTRPCAASATSPPTEREPRRRPGGLPAARARLAAPGASRAASPPASRSTTSRSRCATPTARRAPRTTCSRG